MKNIFVSTLVLLLSLFSIAQEIDPISVSDIVSDARDEAYEKISEDAGKLYEEETNLTDYRCDIEFGTKNFQVFSNKEGAFSDKDASALKMVYYSQEKNSYIKITDAKIRINKVMLFESMQKAISPTSGKIEFVTNEVNTYATQIEITTETTEIMPPMLGMPAVKGLTLNTMCTTIVSLN